MKTAQQPEGAERRHKGLLLCWLSVDSYRLLVISYWLSVSGSNNW
jgi:hypothetical protein